RQAGNGALKEDQVPRHEISASNVRSLCVGCFEILAYRHIVADEIDIIDKADTAETSCRAIAVRRVVGPDILLGSRYNCLRRDRLLTVASAGCYRPCGRR